MTDRTVAPYGAWRSPIRIDDVVGDVVALAEPWIDGDDVFWLEGRPAEGGRRVLVRAAADGSTADLTPPPFNVRTRVHEYGGGSYVVAGGVGRLLGLRRRPALPARSRRRRRRSRSPRPGRGATPTCASMPPAAASARSARTTAARASRSNTIVDVPLDGERVRRVLVTGPDFVAAPRLSPDGAQPRLARVGPPGHALGRDPPAGRADRAGRDARRVRPRRRRPGRVDRPARVVARRHAPPRQRPQRLVEPVPAGRRARGSSRWRRWRRSSPTRPGSSTAPSYGFLADGSIVAVGRRGRPRPPRSRSSPGDLVGEVETPFTELEGLQVGPGGIVVARRRAGRARPSSCASTPRRSPRPACCAGRARSPSTRRPSRCPSRSSSRPAAAGPRTRSTTRRATRRSTGRAGERPPLIVLSARRPDLERVDRARPRHPVLDQPRDRRRRRRLRRQHRLRPRVPPRSSTGRGASSTSTIASPRRRFLVERGDVDPGRLAIAGGSAGGYTTLAALAFRDVFAAGISHYGVGDLELLGPRDAQVRIALPRPAGRAVSGGGRALSRALADPLPSTGSRARCSSSRASTTGSSPPAQAEAIVAALAANGIPHAYLAFEGEGHGFRGATAIRRALEAELVVPRPGLRLRARPTTIEPRRRWPASTPGGRRRAAGAADRHGLTRPARPWTPRPRSSSSSLLLVVALGLAYLARRIGIAYPIVLVLGGLVLGFVLVRVGNVPRDRARRRTSSSCCSCRRSCSGRATSRRSATSRRTCGRSACWPSGSCCSRRSSSRWSPTR